MDLYITRHGQTDGKANKIMDGIRDIDLNETGIEQAKTTRETLSKITDRSIIASLNHNQFEFADNGYAFYDYIENGILKSKEINKKFI